jgi:hypothetical protein
VHRIILTRFGLNRMDTHCCVVVNQIDLEASQA